jgi:excisionase family DNA binding protein
MSDEHSEPAIEPAVLTVNEVAAYLRVTRATVYRLLKARKLPAFQVGSDWRFRVEDIERWRVRAEKRPAYGRTSI